MSRLWTLYWKEMLTYFVSPTAYIILFVFLGVNGVTFYFYLTAYGGNLEALLLSQYGLMPFWFLSLLVPALLTMRSFAEEKRSGTFELLATTGISDATFVGAKFLAAWTFFFFLWLTVLPLFGFVTWEGGTLDWGVLTTIHIGLALLGAVLCGVGVFASTLTKNQLVAASVSTVIGLLLFFLNSFRYFWDAGKFELHYFNFISPQVHFSRDFSRGVFDYRYLILYLSVTWFMLFLATKSLERRRWW